MIPYSVSDNVDDSTESCALLYQSRPLEDQCRSQQILGSNQFMLFRCAEHAGDSYWKSCLS